MKKILIPSLSLRRVVFYIMGLTIFVFSMVSVSLITSGDLSPFGVAENNSLIIVPEENPISDPILVANIEAGERIYKQYCVACHQADGKGFEGKLAADFTNPERMKKTDEELLKSIREGTKGEAGAMPPWGGTLTEEEMKNVLYYIRTNFQKVTRFHEIPHEAYEEFEHNKARPFYVKERDKIDEH